MLGISFHTGRDQSLSILESVVRGRTMFVLVLSYTHTSEIPGITIAGADPESIKYTPPADAEYIQLGHCKCIPGIPMTPDGKPTPALLTRTALQLSGIPFLAVDAGGLVPPQIPHIRTYLEPGHNIAQGPSMTVQQARQAMASGQYLGDMLSAVCDCIVLGESIPGGTTTALATMHGLNLPARVSSSMPDNPHAVKDDVVRAALGRLGMDDYVRVASQTSDPMLLFVSSMLASASRSSNVILAGGTQMLAVLALSSKIGFDATRTALCTTSYVLQDPGVGFVEQAAAISPISVMSVDPELQHSGYSGLQSYANGFAKEGAGAGGALASAMVKLDMTPSDMLLYIDGEYSRICA